MNGDRQSRIAATRSVIVINPCSSEEKIDEIQLFVFGRLHIHSVAGLDSVAGNINLMGRGLNTIQRDVSSLIRSVSIDFIT